MTNCYECGEAEAKFEDPRTPPIEVGLCLCSVCLQPAIEDRREELEAELETLKGIEKILIGRE